MKKDPVKPKKNGQRNHRPIAAVDEYRMSQTDELQKCTGKGSLKIHGTEKILLR